MKNQWMTKLTSYEKDVLSVIVEEVHARLSFLRNYLGCPGACKGRYIVISEYLPIESLNKYKYP